MDQKTILKISAERFEKRTAVMCKKSEVYSVGGKDKLRNFKDAAFLLDCTAEEALLGFVTKHIIALKDVIQSGKIPDNKWIDEYLGDIHNYMDLLECLWEEEKAQESDDTELINWGTFFVAKECDENIEEVREKTDTVPEDIREIKWDLDPQIEMSE